jgi:LacI family transcriptional regulator
MPAQRHESPGRVTLAAIAAAAGVSVPTVSKVVNGRADVAPGTRSRIESLIAEYDYVLPRRAADRRTGLLDLVFTELSPWAVEIIRGAEETALRAGSRVTVSLLDGAEQADRWLNSLTEIHTDGVIMVLTELTAGQRSRLAELRVPVVIVDPVGRPDPHIPSIGAANWAGGLSATEHLIGMGHRRIGTVTGPAALLCSRARLDGYRAALERAGIGVDPDLIEVGDFHFESGLERATRMLARPDPPTAIFAASDMMAMGVYEAARLRHLRVPDRLSVVGFDDLPMSAWVSPPLTTVLQPLAEMARMATRTLLGLIDGGPRSFNNRMELSTSLVVRSSTAPPSQHQKGNTL